MPATGRPGRIIVNEKVPYSQSLPSPDGAYLALQAAGRLAALLLRAAVRDLTRFSLLRDAINRRRGTLARSTSATTSAAPTRTNAAPVLSPAVK